MAELSIHPASFRFSERGQDLIERGIYAQARETAASARRVFEKLGIPLLIGGGTFEFSRIGAQFALDIVTGRAAGPGARTMYLALFTAAPTDATTMTTLPAEAPETGYARQIAAFTAPTAADPPETHNSAVLTFGPLTGTLTAVSHFGLVSSASGTTGDFAAWGVLTAARTPASGDSFQAAIAAFSITCT